MKFIVPVKRVDIEIFRVEARNKTEAMDLALADDDPLVCESIELIDGDSECYYPDIYEELP